MHLFDKGCAMVVIHFLKLKVMVKTKYSKMFFFLLSFIRARSKSTVKSQSFSVLSRLDSQQIAHFIHSKILDMIF